MLRLAHPRHLVCAALVAVAACSQPRDPIVIEGGSIVIENQTKDDWIAVEVWINNHFRGTVGRLPAGGRTSAPLNHFVAAFGQKFDRTRQSVFGVEVTARTEAGEPVRLVWGSGRQR
jgi:hypothetical protein